MFINFVRKEFFQNSIALWCSFRVWLFIEMIFIHGALFLKTISLFVVCKVICADHVIYFKFDVKRTLTVFWRQFCRRDIILLQVICICFAEFVSRNHILIFICNLFNCIINKNIYVYFQNMNWCNFKNVNHCFQTFILRYQQFFIKFIVDLCQIIDTYVIVGFTMVEYIYLNFCEDLAEGICTPN